MAEHVKHLRGNILATVLLGALLGASGEGGAQMLADPTRPPEAVTAPHQGGAAQPGAAGPVLQSILISPTRREAIVDGRTVRVGDRIGDARVTGIAEGRLTLRTGGATQTLSLYPELRKQPNSDRSRAGAGEQRK